MLGARSSDWNTTDSGASVLDCSVCQNYTDARRARWGCDARQKPPVIELYGEPIFECPSKLANTDDPLVRRVWAAYQDRERGHWEPSAWNSAIVEGVRYLESIRGMMDMESFRRSKKQAAKQRAQANG